MIRWVAVLLICLAGVLAVLGEDHGQKRAGLMAAPEPVQVQVAAAPEPAAEPAKPAEVFLPVKPQLIPAPAEGQPLVTEAAVEVAAPAAEPVAEAEVVEAAAPLADQQLAALQGVNLRTGPGRNFPVQATLTAGEVVAVLPDDDPSSGWRHVRRADGSMGYAFGDLMGAAP